MRERSKAKALGYLEAIATAALDSLEATGAWPLEGTARATARLVVAD
jgi:hypothetical protein